MNTGTLILKQHKWILESLSTVNEEETVLVEQFQVSENKWDFNCSVANDSCESILGSAPNCWGPGEVIWTFTPLCWGPSMWIWPHLGLSPWTAWPPLLYPAKIETSEWIMKLNENSNSLYITFYYGNSFSVWWQKYILYKV